MTENAGKCHRLALVCLLSVTGLLLGEEMPPEVLTRVRAATAFLRVSLEGAEAQGSGFLVSHGLLVTNIQVLDIRDGGRPPKAIKATFNSGVPGKEVSVSANYAGADLRGGLAFLTLGATGPGVLLPAPLRLASADQLRETQPVFIMGFPFGDELALKRNPELTVGTGSISSLRLTPAGDLECVQVKGDMSPGSNGGPVVDREGLVVGVSKGSVPGTQIGMAIPCNILQGSIDGRPWGRKVLNARATPTGLEGEILIGTLDPRARIRSLRAMMWSAPTGTERPVDPKTKRSDYGAADDSKPLRIVLARGQDGIWKGMLRSMAADPGRELWIQYVWEDIDSREQKSDAYALGPARDWGKTLALPPVSIKPLGERAPTLAAATPQNVSAADPVFASKPAAIPEPVVPPDAKPLEEAQVTEGEKGHLCVTVTAKHLGTVSLGAELLQLRSHPTGREVYAIFRERSGVQVLDPVTLKATHEIPTVRLPVSLWCDAYGMAVACSESRTVMVLDPEQRGAVDSYQFAEDPACEPRSIVSRAPDGSLLTIWRAKTGSGKNILVKLGPGTEVSRVFDNAPSFLIATHSGTRLLASSLIDRPNETRFVNDAYLLTTTGGPAAFPRGTLPPPGFERRFNRVFLTHDQRYVVLPATSNQDGTSVSFVTSPDLSRLFFTLPGLAFTELPGKDALITLDFRLPVTLRYISRSSGATIRMVQLPRPTEEREQPVHPIHPVPPHRMPGPRFPQRPDSTNGEPDIGSMATYVPGHELVLIRTPGDFGGRVHIFQVGPLKEALEVYSPVLRNDPPSTVEPGAAYAWTPEVASAGKELKFKLAEGPAGATTDPETGCVRWQTELGQAGPQLFRLTAEVDGKTLVVREWQVSVAGADGPPPPDAPQPKAVAEAPKPRTVPDTPQPKTIPELPKPKAVTNDPRPITGTDQPKPRIPTDTPPAPKVADAPQPRTVPNAPATNGQTASAAGTSPVKTTVAITRQQLDTLTAPASQIEMTPKAAANTYQNAVVLIRHARGTAGGFLVGADGWIVTCAHILPLREGLIQATLYSPRSNSTVTLKATLVARDFGRDLVLLKVTPGFAATSVRLEGDRSPGKAEDVSILGNPGLGDTPVSTSLTPCSISEPKRTVDGSEFVELKVTIDPGVQGSPLFNSFGNVIGMITLRANSEAGTLAIPAGRLKQFLEDCCTDGQRKKE